MTNTDLRLNSDVDAQLKCKTSERKYYPPSQRLFAIEELCLPTSLITSRMRYDLNAKEYGEWCQAMAECKHQCMLIQIKILLIENLQKLK